MADVKYLNEENYRRQMNLEDKDYTDWHSKNTIIFGSLIEDGWDWGREDWSCYSLSDEHLLELRPRLNEKIEDTFFFREIGTLPPARFKRDLKMAITQAVTAQGLVYTELFKGIDIYSGKTNFEGERIILSDYPQSQLQPDKQDYASKATDRDLTKRERESKLDKLLQLQQQLTEPDQTVLDAIEKCFSNLLSFDF